MTEPAPDDPDDTRVRKMFTAFSATTRRRAPLYSAMSDGIAGDRDLLALLRSAPPTQRQPVILFAALHHLVLAAPDDDLAQWYPNIVDEPRSPDDPALMPTIAEFVAAHRGEIDHLLATRSTQTNEVGRCAFLVPVFSMLAGEVGPLGHLDIGTSAGLTLLSDRYRYRYRSGDGGTSRDVGDASSVTIDADTLGPFPAPDVMPSISSRLGVDRSPIDVTDGEATRWLEACVWPDQADRFDRLVAALEVARRSPPPILAGDATSLLATGVEQVGAGAHPVVTNSWVLNYFTPEARLAHLAELDRIGTQRDLSWISAEAPAQTPELPMAADLVDSQLTVLSLARWRNGHRTVTHLATCHPHGYWIHWR